MISVIHKPFGGTSGFGRSDSNNSISSDASMTIANSHHEVALYRDRVIEIWNKDEVILGAMPFEGSNAPAHNL